LLPKSSLEDAVKLINTTSGKHFDPSVAVAFNQVIDELLSIRKKHSD